MKDKPHKTEKPKTPKAEPQQAIDEKTVVAIVTALGRVSKCLLMCAPKFADGSEGSVAVDLARRSIPVVRNILNGKAEKKGGAK